MVFASERGDISIAACGDFILGRRVSVSKEPGFLKLVDLLQNSDVAFANLEEVIVRDEGWPDEAKNVISVAGPHMLDELKWAGINLVSCANNHAYDYGIAGVLAAIKYVDQAGIVHAGTGENLGRARAPAYLDTAAGRVALVSLATSTITPGRAGEQRPDFKGRPGVNILRTQTVNYVDPQTFDQVRRLSAVLGYERRKENARRFFPHNLPQDTDEQFHFLRNKFVVGQECAARYVANEQDVAAVLKSIREARRQADWVITSVHWHDQEQDLNVPSAFLQAFARECVNQGTDVFVGHGPHQLCGIEVHKGKPIFYSLANFACQLETQDFLHDEAYREVGLGWEATPADVYDARTKLDTRGWVTDPVYWESVCAIVHFKGWALDNIELYPLDLGFKGPRTQRGRPVIADGPTGARVLSRLNGLCAPFGTGMAVKEGRGVIAS